jgi:hypothetical protein
MTETVEPSRDLVFGRGLTVAPGRAAGLPFLLAEPLSFWGGFDVHTGCISDRRHPDHRQSLAGRVVLMAKAKGSSSSSSVLAEAVRKGTAPAALVMAEPDLIIALGAMVADELYGVRLPIVTADTELRQFLASTTVPVQVEADADGVCTFAWAPIP